MRLQHTNLTLHFSQIESQVGDPLCLLPFQITLHFLIIFPDDVWDEVLALSEGICLTPYTSRKLLVSEKMLDRCRLRQFKEPYSASKAHADNNKLLVKQVIGVIKLLKPVQMSDNYTILIRIDCS